MTSLALQRYCGMAPMTALLEWRNTGSLGRAGIRDEEGASPSMSMSSWSACVELCL